mgnify:CR=1 FL=1
MIAEGRLKGGDRLPPERGSGRQVRWSAAPRSGRLSRALESLEPRGDQAGQKARFVREASIESLVEPLAL